ncbi:sentrin-specific protease 5-like isoform X2 [Gadus macrocephalus]|uniref:sentrin-specific protease 5-like isoform X2 n=1 Tax=Gadus macrocephalus TaxID=80720 RepID=UPI0028CB39C6|nr:sentrin-specific protease 5-like isoform X2 [Gadus macrocephalus]
MGKLRLEMHDRTGESKRPHGSTKGLAHNLELSKKRWFSIRRFWMWRRRERAKSCFFFTQRNGVKHKRRPVHSSSFCNRQGDVKICLEIQGEVGRDRNISETPPEKENGETSGVLDGGELKGSGGEVCQPALASTSNSTDRPQTPDSGGSTKRQGSGVGCTDKNMVNGFKRIAVHQEPWRDPVCPQETCTPLGAELVTEGKTSTRTSPSPVCQSLPGLGVSSDSHLQPVVPHKALSSTIMEFLDGFSKVYGSLIPLQSCDIVRSLRAHDLGDRKRNLVISLVKKYSATVVRTTSPCFRVVYRKHSLMMEDLATLAHQNWINDQVINMYGELIMESTDNKVHFLNSFFHHQLEMKGYEGVRRWTKQVDLFSKQLLLVPVHLEVHWSLVAVDPEHRSIRLYDSEFTALPEVTLGILKYLISEAKEKSQELFQTGWVVSANQETPQQNNENDCGVFVLEYCKRLALRKPLDFSQKEIPHIRKRIYKELCERKLHL